MTRQNAENGNLSGQRMPPTTQTVSQDRRQQTERMRPLKTTHQTAENTGTEHI